MSEQRLSGTFHPSDYQIYQMPSFKVRTDAALKRIEEKLAGWQPLPEPPKG